jgi:hypothetical protein
MSKQTSESVQPVRTVNFARILPLFAPSTQPGILMTRRNQTGTLLRERQASQSLGLSRGTKCPITQLEKVAVKPFSLEKVTGTLSPIAGSSSLTPVGQAEIDLPPGIPRFINAATLKKMLRAKRSDLLLRRVGERWEVVENSASIDLHDDAVEFRLGAIQVFS